MGDGTSQGLKWIGIIVLYFIIMTFVVSVVTMATSGGIISSTLDEPKSARCDEPRLIYTPYNLTPISTEGMSVGNLNNYLGSLSCELSEGVLSNGSCTYIHGCTWASKNVSIITQFWWWITNSNTTTQPTCLGVINASYYNISTVTRLISRATAVAPNDGLSNKITGSACADPSVLNNQTTCEMLSCTWLSDYQASQLDVSKLNLNPSLFTFMWKSVTELVTFRFSFGIDSTFITYFLNFIIFYLPLLLLVGAVVGIIRG